MVAEVSLPQDDAEGGQHAYTIQASDDTNINYYRLLQSTWQNAASTSYWLGFQFYPKQVESWAGFGLYKELVIIGKPYNSQQQGIGGMSGSKVIIENSKDYDSTWFVIKMEMKGPGKIQYLYVRRNSDNTQDAGH